jgi:hypothetical protein
MLTHCGATWIAWRLNGIDGIAQQDYIQIKTFVEESMAAAEAALVKADSFVCHAAQQSTSKVRGTKSEDVHS